MKKTLFVLIILSSFFFCKQVEKNEIKKEKEETESFFPAIKTARHWTSPVIKEEQVEKLAQTDILTVDLENMFNNYHYLVKIKQLNPKLKLLCYSNPMEIWTIKYSNRPWQNKVIDEIINNRQKWLLKKNSGEALTFWPNMIMLNMSRNCPLIGFERYSAWMARKLNKEVLSDSIWDGYLMDNATPNISWVAPGTIDINNNQRVDEDSRVDMSWERGVRRFLKIIRRHNKDDFIIIGNKGDHSFLDIVDGKMFENFPNNWLGDTWADGFNQSIDNAKKTGEYTIFSIKLKEVEFALASALLLDNIYLAIGQDYDGSHESLLIDLGEPIEPYQEKDSKYWRKYEKGIVTVWPLERKGEIKQN